MGVTPSQILSPGPQPENKKIKEQQKKVNTKARKQCRAGPASERERERGDVREEGGRAGERQQQPHHHNDNANANNVRAKEKAATRACDGEHDLWCRVR